ncbi:MAG TPA: ATP synthase F1 subunit delta [Caldimonas sp.]
MAAGRYARALFDVVLKEAPADLETVESQVRDLGSLFTGMPALAGAMSNPAVPLTKKVAVAGAILEKSGAIAAPVRQMVLMLAERGRLVLLPDIARVYGERLMDHQRVIRGEVTTARALAPDKLRGLEQGLAQATGRRVVLESKVNPEIIGGIVARLGGTVYDGSVTTQLHKLKQSLLDAGQ